MDDRTFNVWPGGIAKRAAITVAASAVLMAGLHYAPLRGFSPGAILLGHPEEVAAIPAAPEARPTIRFIAIPAREAFPPAPAAATSPAVAALPADLPMTVSVIPTPRPAYVAEAKRPAGPVAPVVAALVRPTPRPEMPAAAALPEMGEMPTMPTKIARIPSQDVRSEGARPAPELELLSELVPEPRDDQRSFELADLVPSPRGMLRGVATVGRTVGHGARYAVNGIADGAMTIVGR